MLKHAVIVTVFLTAFARPTFAQQSLREADALAAVKLATNPTAKLAAAEEFIARFPKSTSRLTIGELVAAEIGKVQNGTVAVTLVERAWARPVCKS